MTRIPIRPTDRTSLIKWMMAQKEFQGPKSIDVEEGDAGELLCVAVHYPDDKETSALLFRTIWGRDE